MLSFSNSPYPVNAVLESKQHFFDDMCIARRGDVTAVASTFKKSNLLQMTGMSAMTLPLILDAGYWLTSLSQHAMDHQ
jgi:hypothetical protein